jgi:hypothetical protein
MWLLALTEFSSIALEQIMYAASPTRKARFCLRNSRATNSF